MIVKYSGGAAPRPAKSGRTVVFTLSLASLALLAGCHDHNAKPAAPAPPDAQSVVAMLQSKVDSGELPTLDITSSVLGTDANANGVRDDIDALIAKQTDGSAQKAALTQAAQSLQATLGVDPTNAPATAAAALGVRKAIACLFTQYDGKTAAGRLHWVQEMSINTLARLQAYDRFNIALNNSVAQMETGGVCNA